MDTDMEAILRGEKRVPLTGVILAGGKKRHSSGLHPALLPFRRERMVNRQFRLMRPICEELILVTDEPKLILPVLDADVRLITDYYANRGPLGGLHAALSLAGHGHVWLAGCDMPFLSPRAALVMLQRKRQYFLDAVVPCIHGKLNPLHGVFGRSLAKLAAKLSMAGRHSILALLDDISCGTMEEKQFHIHGIDMHFMIRTNTAEAYEDALKMQL